MGKVNETGKGLNIMVTGGSGFLGSHIADALTDAGHKVTIFDIKESPYLREGQDMVVGDILDQDDLVRRMKGMDIVFHLAALADLDTAHNSPHETMKINVLGTTNVLEAARANNVNRVVFASTIYVNSRTGSFYRVSKHSCELLFEGYNERYDLDYTILRFGTLYGPRANENNSVFRYLKEALETGKIEFKGTGKEVREYIHVRDAARVCTKILGEDFNGKTLILTGHHRMRLEEFLNMVKEILDNRNRKIDVTTNPKESEAHYVQTPYSYIPRVGEKIVTNTYCDFGQSLVEILDEIGTKKSCDEIEIEI
jgi:UDP-glucose 4-epimerase